MSVTGTAARTLLFAVLGLTLSACVYVLDADDQTPVGCLEDSHCPPGLACARTTPTANRDEICQGECLICVDTATCPEGCRIYPCSYCDPTRGCIQKATTEPDYCHDGNVEDGDGCTSGCIVEPGWTCTGAISVCHQCGNGAREGPEACDDGNLENGDGCSETCTVED